MWGLQWVSLWKVHAKGWVYILDFLFLNIAHKDTVIRGKALVKWLTHG